MYAFHLQGVSGVDDIKGDDTPDLVHVRYDSCQTIERFIVAVWKIQFFILDNNFATRFSRILTVTFERKQSPEFALSK